MGSFQDTPSQGLACNPGMCPDQELNQQPFGPWDNTQPTEPHESGLTTVTFKEQSENLRGRLFGRQILKVGVDPAKIGGFLR